MYQHVITVYQQVLLYVGKSFVSKCYFVPASAVVN